MFRDLEEPRNDPDSFPFEEHIKETTLRKSYLHILAVLLNIPIKNYIFVVVLLAEGLVQGAVRKELIIVLFIIELYYELIVRVIVPCFRLF